MNDIDPYLNTYVFTCVAALEQKGRNFIQVQMTNVLGSKIELCFDTYEQSTDFLNRIGNVHVDTKTIIETYYNIMIK